MDENTVLLNLADAEYESIVLRELLDSVLDRDFVFTLEGAKKHYSDFSKDEPMQALFWMDEHYDHIAAVMRAAALISASLNKHLEDLEPQIKEMEKEETTDAEN